MPNRRRKYNDTSPTFGLKKFGAAFRRHLKENDLLVRAQKHQTFPWLIGSLEEWLDEELIGATMAKEPSARAQSTLRKMSLETLQTLYNLRRRENLITEPSCVDLVSQELIPNVTAREQFRSTLQEQCRVYLYQTLGSEPVNVPPVTKPEERRKPNRKRDELPDPNRPAWSSVNRRKSQKVQLSCRVERHVKGRIKAAAFKLGQSQAAWIEAAVVNALLDQGYELRRKRHYNANRHTPLSSRRTRRLKLPEPRMSHHASVNRADQSTTVRVCKGLANRIDRAKGFNKTRSEWLNEAIHTFAGSKEAPPKRMLATGPLSEVVSLRFDRDFFAELEIIIRDAGYSKSDWFRGVALWRVKNYEISET